jgi:hypothetical protein
MNPRCKKGDYRAAPIISCRRLAEQDHMAGQFFFNFGFWWKKVNGAVAGWVFFIRGIATGAKDLVDAPLGQLPSKHKTPTMPAKAEARRR